VLRAARLGVRRFVALSEVHRAPSFPLIMDVRKTFFAAMVGASLLVGCGDDDAPNDADATIPLPDDFIYVADEGTGSRSMVHVFDVDTLAKVAELAVGAGASELHATPDGALVWVLSGDANEVTLIDTATLTTTALDVGVSPVHSYITPGHDAIWVGNDGSGNVSVIDIATRRVTHTILTGAGHHKMALAYDAAGDFTFAYVSNITDGSITPVTPLYAALTNVTGVGPAPHGMDFDVASGLVLNCTGDTDSQTDGNQPGIELIATVDDPGTPANEQHTVVDRVPLAAGRCGYLHVEDGDAYFTIGAAGLIGRMDIATRDVETFAAGTRPDKFAHEGDLVFVANVTTPTVSVVSLTGGALAPIATENPIEPGTMPTGGHRSIRRHEGRLYVPNAFDGSVTVIDIATRTVVGTLTGMTHPTNIAVAGPSGGSTYPR
jgi:YVTN family beta-propeller protein